VSTTDLDYLRNSGRSLLLLPNEFSESLEIKSKNPMALKLKKRVTFTNSSPVIQQHDEFEDGSVYTNLDRTTSNCVQMFGELRTSNASSSMDASILANDFRDSCQISLPNGYPVSTGLFNFEIRITSLARRIRRRSSCFGCDFYLQQQIKAIHIQITNPKQTFNSFSNHPQQLAQFSKALLSFSVPVSCITNSTLDSVNGYNASFAPLALNTGI
jgi:hypothetical protein